MLNFIIFSLITSIVYILNDIQDINYDKQHPVKKRLKPLANGSLSVFFAINLIILLVILISFLLLYESTILIIVIFYLIFNLSYTYFLKQIPFLDILIISIGYILRVESGSKVIEVQSSLLMLCSIFFLSMFIMINKKKKRI